LCAAVLELEIQLETTYGLCGIISQKMNKVKKEEVDTLSEWIKAIMSLVQIRINIFKRSMSTKATSVFNASNLRETMSTIYEKYVVFSCR
jgi:hypothetical protein